jgi:predicted nucleotidyltransferase
LSRVPCSISRLPESIFYRYYSSESNKRIAQKYRLFSSSNWVCDLEGRLNILSRSNATAGKDSDLDLAVLVAGYAPSLLLFDLSGVLEDIVGCAVDVLDLRAASTVMQYQILQKGRRLWGR